MTPDYVAWVPLAPGETYYGRGYYGPHSVNITNVNINQINVTKVYKNVYVNNGVTIVNRDTFATASPKIIHINRNIIQQKIFARNNISIGTPAIKPTKASYFASAKPIPMAKLPPQTIRNLQVKELKRSRPFMRKPDKSVLNPGARPKTLPVNTVTTPRTPGKGKPMIQSVRPGEKGKPGVLFGPGPKGERLQVKSPKKKPARPEGGPQSRGMRQQVKPEKRPAGTEGGSPARRGVRPQVKPAEKKKGKPGVAEGGLGQKGAKKPAKPAKGNQKKKTEEPEIK
jgi:hypothetical protein